MVPSQASSAGDPRLAAAPPAFLAHLDYHAASASAAAAVCQAARHSHQLGGVQGSPRPAPPRGHIRGRAACWQTRMRMLPQRCCCAEAGLRALRCQQG
eukprot:1141469-Pelagomonas_calceolata.AAC.6